MLDPILTAVIAVIAYLLGMRRGMQLAHQATEEADRAHEAFFGNRGAVGSPGTGEG